MNVTAANTGIEPVKLVRTNEFPREGESVDPGLFPGRKVGHQSLFAVMNDQPS